MKKLESEASAPQSKQKLLWFNVFAVIPFLLLSAKAISSHDGFVTFWALTFAPVALTVIGLDVYYFVKRHKQ